MDQLAELPPVGSNVWVIPREMYSSVCICVANRTSDAQLVTVDCSSSSNVTMLASEEDRVKNQPLAVRRVVSAGATQVVAVLSPADDAEPTAISFVGDVVAKSIEGNLGGALGDRAAAHNTMVEVERQSADVEAFLNRRR